MDHRIPRLSSWASRRTWLRVRPSPTGADWGKMEFSDSVLLSILVSDPASIGQSDPAMNQTCSYRWFVSACLRRGVRSALTICGIIRSQVKKHFRIPLLGLGNRKVLLWSAISLVGPDVQLALQLSLTFLGSVGGLALGYTWRVVPRRQTPDGRYHDGDRT